MLKYNRRPPRAGWLSPHAPPASPFAFREGWGEGGSGIYHLTAVGQTSWYGFAKAILESMSLQGAHPSLITHQPLTEVNSRLHVRIPAARGKTSAANVLSLIFKENCLDLRNSKVYGLIWEA
jgi:hypothetical protein